MKSAIFTVKSNQPLAPGVFELVLSGDASMIERPGQFVEISVPGHFLRRPISVCDWTADSLTLLVRTVGGGTAWLEKATPGTPLDILLPLGNGFDLSAVPAGLVAILAGGGIGIAPLYALAKALLAKGVECRVALGFRCGRDVFFAERFSALGCDVAVATEDGSLGAKGFVTDAIRRIAGLPSRESGMAGERNDGMTATRPRPYVFACGPMPMLRALAAIPGFAGAQFSLEARMGCGFGACMGCTVETASGPARVCREGPVFTLEELKW